MGGPKVPGRFERQKPLAAVAVTVSAFALAILRSKGWLGPLHHEGLGLDGFFQHVPVWRKLDVVIPHALLAPLVGVWDIVVTEIHEGPTPLEGQRPSLGDVAALDAGADHVTDRGKPLHGVAGLLHHVGYTLDFASITACALDIMSTLGPWLMA